MSDSGEAPQIQPAGSPDGASRSARRRDAGAVAAVCPLLVSDDAAWRSAYASRDHRCWAVRPPAPLTLAKQRELCLTSDHAGCTTYAAVHGGPKDDGDPASVDPRSAGSLLWPAVRSTPLALEPSRGRTGALPLAPGRAGGQALLVGLMVLAFLVLVIARTSGPSQAGSSPPGASGAIGVSPSIGPTPSAVPSAMPGGSPSVVPSATPGGSPAPASQPPPSATAAATPSPTPGASAVRRYTVKSGDTLSSIAARFGVTVTAIATANGITDRRLIRVGQVLVIP